MRTLTLLFSFIILSTLALSAQQPIPSNAMPPVTAAGATASVTIQGCVLGFERRIFTQRRCGKNLSSCWRRPVAVLGTKSSRNR